MNDPREWFASRLLKEGRGVGRGLRLCRLVAEARRGIAPIGGIDWDACRWGAGFPRPTTRPRPRLQAGFLRLDPSAIGFDPGFTQAREPG